MTIQSVFLIAKRIAIDQPCPEIVVDTGMLLVIHGGTLENGRERGIRFCMDKVSGHEIQDKIEELGVICFDKLVCPD